MDERTVSANVARLCAELREMTDKELILSNCHAERKSLLMYAIGERTTAEIFELCSAFGHEILRLRSATAAQNNSGDDEPCKLKFST